MILDIICILVLVICTARIANLIEDIIELRKEIRQIESDIVVLKQRLEEYSYANYNEDNI